MVEFRSEDQFQEIRDTLYGDILLYSDEIELLNAWEMQRLRNIRQLGFAHLVYPGANHTRFEHCIGARYMLQQVIERSQLEKYFEHEGDIRILYKAALIHDIGHSTFGHITERLGVQTHEEITISMINGKMNDVLVSVIDDENIKPFISDLIGGEKSITNFLDEKERRMICDILSKKSKPIFYSQLISGLIDADILDYLRRDSYYCGLHYGFYDDRILSAFDVDEDKLDLVLKYKPDSISSALSVLESRLKMMKAVYRHHTVLAADSMLLKALEMAFGEIIHEEDIYLLDDEEVLDILTKSESETVKNLAYRLKRRDLYKRAYVVQNKTRELETEIEKMKNNAVYMREMMKKIAKRSSDLGLIKLGERKISVEDIIVNMPIPRSYREMHDTVLLKRGDGDEKERIQLGWESPSVNALTEEYNRLWTFFVYVSDPNFADYVKDACKEIFGIESAYDRSKGRITSPPALIEETNTEIIKKVFERIEEMPRASLEPIKVLLKSDNELTRDEISKELGIESTTVSSYLNKILSIEKEFGVGILKYRTDRNKIKFWKVRPEMRDIIGDALMLLE
ncbi:MAG: hypothetical protein A7316_02555 [Candidatus Altiarchaeales archaeon WOR_SM1_86-2]|nr:MAG: hypothetical protein A7316_02555 [Candidatus Altiarchaeales archaeon WOR_SM1_86-2]